MRIDAHQHYWKPSRGDYGWMDAPDLGDLRRDYLPADLEPWLSRHRIDRTVVVQAAPTRAETDFLLDLARAHQRIAGVVGWLDLEAPDFPDVLGQYLDNPKFLGIRPMLQDLADDDFILKPKVIENLSHLAHAGKTLDLLVVPRQLPYVVRALDLLPELGAVVDHVAKPRPRHEHLDAWRAWMTEIAGRPRLVCKLSGLVTEVGPGFSAADLAPAVEHVFSEFGPERLLFGSDWPVCTLVASYDQVIQVLYDVLGERLSGTTEEQVFGGNARRFYGL